MRSARLLAVAVLAVVLALSSAQNAFAAVELYYDDGDWDASIGAIQAGSLAAVRFSPPPGWSMLLTARYYIDLTSPLNTFRVHIYGSDLGTEVCCTPPLDVTPSGTGWFDVDLYDYHIMVDGGTDFHIGLEWLVPLVPYIGADIDSAPSLRSYDRGWTPGGEWRQWQNGNLMIRAVVDPVGPTEEAPPVGGVVVPANTLAILGPWLAVIGLVGCVTAAAVVAKKRRP